jgi:hypothetical protein
MGREKIRSEQILAIWSTVNTLARRASRGQTGRVLGLCSPQ